MAAAPEGHGHGARRLLRPGRRAAVGFVAVDLAGSIPLVLVAPGHQRRGIGTDLLSAALDPMRAGRRGARSRRVAAEPTRSGQACPPTCPRRCGCSPTAAGRRARTPSTWLPTWRITGRPRPPPELCPGQHRHRAGRGRRRGCRDGLRDRHLPALGPLVPGREPATSCSPATTRGRSAPPCCSTARARTQSSSRCSAGRPPPSTASGSHPTCKDAASAPPWWCARRRYFATEVPAPATSAGPSASVLQPARDTGPGAATACSARVPDSFASRPTHFDQSW